MIRWLFRVILEELLTINKKLDKILVYLGDEKTISEQAERLRQSSDALEKAVNEQKKV